MTATDRQPEKSTSRLRPALLVLKWLSIVGVGLAVLCGAVLLTANDFFKQTSDPEENTGSTGSAPHPGRVFLDSASARRYGLKTQAAKSVPWCKRVVVYGQVIPNPQATTTITAPVAGMVRAGPKDPWPAPGQWIEAGQILGWLDIRITPQDRLAVEDNLNRARLQHDGARKVAALRQARVKRLEQVTRSDIVSPQQLDDARVLLAEANSKVAIADAAVKLWQKALKAIKHPGTRKEQIYRQPLMAPAAGEVSELFSRPGVSIEAGEAILQLIDVRRPLLQLDLPPELALQGAPSPIKVQALATAPPRANESANSPAAADLRFVDAELIGPAPRLDPVKQFIRYWYEVNLSRASQSNPALDEAKGKRPYNPLWRPGLQVKSALTPAAATQQEVVSVPASAVLFHQGRTFVYVRVEQNVYERRPVQVLERDGTKSFLALKKGAASPGIEPGDEVVIRAAQVLLSEEFQRDSSGH